MAAKDDVTIHTVSRRKKADFQRVRLVFGNADALIRMRWDREFPSRQRKLKNPIWNQLWLGLVAKWKKWYELNNSSLYLEPQALCGTLPLRWQEPGLGIQLLHLRCILASTCHPRKLPAPADPQELTFWSWGAGWSVEPKLLSPLPYFWFIKNRTLEKILDTVHNGIKLDSFLLGGKKWLSSSGEVIREAQGEISMQRFHLCIWLPL